MKLYKEYKGIYYGFSKDKTGEHWILSTAEDSDIGITATFDAGWKRIDQCLESFQEDLPKVKTKYGKNGK